MEHMAWKGRIKPGCKAEYQRRHAEIWPEMVKVLKEAVDSELLRCNQRSRNNAEQQQRGKKSCIQPVLSPRSF